MKMIVVALALVLASAAHAAGPLTYPTGASYCYPVDVLVSPSGLCCHYADNGVPDGTKTVANKCDEYRQVDVTPNEMFDAGAVGSTQWTRRVTGTASPCGNGMLEGAEQCDVGVIGSCVSVPDCNLPNEDSNPGNDCTCATTPALCGNGMFDVGEACDPMATDEEEIAGMACTPDNCTGSCLCNCGPQAGGGPIGGTCGDTQKQQSCVGLGGLSENCELSQATSSGPNFGGSIQFNAAGYFQDTVAGRFSPGTNDLIIEVAILPNAVQSAPQTIAWFGGQTTGTSGCMIGTLTSRQARLYCAQGGVDGNVTSALNGTRLIADGVRQYLAFVKSGTTGRIYHLTYGSDTTPVALVMGDSATIANVTSTQLFQIGARNGGADPFDGIIEAVRVRIGANIAAGFEATELASAWASELNCNGLAGSVVSCWYMNEAAGVTSLTDSRTATSATLTSVNAGWTRVSSPFSSSTTTTTSTDCDTATETCNEVTCRCTPKGGQSPQTIYWSPTGDDALNGSSPSLAVKTWPRVAGLVAGPGYTVIARDGTYTPATTGLPDLRCGNGTICNGNATSNGFPCGTPDLPITIRAENLRKAYLSSDGTRPAFRMEWCSDVKIVGFRGSHQNTAVPAGFTEGIFFLTRSRHWEFTKNICHDPNQFNNIHCLSGTDNVGGWLVEGNSFYRFPRHGISLGDSVDGTITLNYFNSRNLADLPGCQPIASCGPTPCCSNQSPGGDEDIALYNASRVVVSNNAFGGQGAGIEAHGGPNSLNAGNYGGSDNLILGNVLIGDYLSLLIDSRQYAPYAARGNIVRDLVVGLNGTRSHPIYLRGASNVTLEGVSSVGATGTTRHGFAADEASAPYRSCAGLASPASDRCEFNIRNMASLENTGAGWSLTDLATDYVCTADRLFTTGNGGGNYGGIFQSQCGPTNVNPNGTTITNFGTDNDESIVFVPSTATALKGQGGTAVNLRVCQAGSALYAPCQADADCPGGGAGSCVNDIGANVICRYEGPSRTRHENTNGRGCAGPGNPFRCCTGLNQGDCDVWARDGDPACNGAACSTPANCTAANADVVGTASMPDCLYHFAGAGAFVPGINDIDGDSEFDFHEELGIDFGVDATDVQPPACP